jgi:cytochrome c oxidase subunit 4
MTIHEDIHGHSGAGKTYLVILTVLLILTAITVAAAGFDFGSLNVVIALSIATVKAAIVALFFMHLRYDKPVNAIIAMSGFLFLGLFLMFSFLDVASRRDPQPANLKPVVAAPAQNPPAQTPAPATKH